jgi:hypothetical protein
LLLLLPARPDVRHARGEGGRGVVGVLRPWAGPAARGGHSGNGAGASYAGGAESLLLSVARLPLALLSLALLALALLSITLLPVALLSEPGRHAETRLGARSLLTLKTLRGTVALR